MARTPSSFVSVRIVDDLAEIDSIAPHWLALEERFADELTFFQSYAWCRAWIETFAGEKGDRRPLIHTVWRDQTLVAVWPLMITDGMSGLRKLEALGEPHSQYCNIICDPDLMDEGAALALADAIGRPDACDVALFRGVPETSRLMTVLAKYPSLAGYANQASILDLSAYETSAFYAAQLGKLQKRNRNRRRNHLARRGELSFEMIWPDHPDFATLVSRCVGMKKVWLAKSGLYSVGLSLAGHSSFLSGLRGDSGRLCGACLSVLRVAGNVVALELGFIHNRHYYAYLGGFDWDLRSCSPGKVQMEFTVCWLIDHGIGAYDLLGDPAGYKVSWSNRAIGLRAFAKPYSLKGRIYTRAWLPVIRPALKRLYRATPDFLRRMTRGAHALACLLHV